MLTPVRITGKYEPQKSQFPPLPEGGTRSYRPPPALRWPALKTIGMLPAAAKLDGCLKGQTVVVMGNSHTLNETNLEPLRQFQAVGCNRALWHPTIWPEFLVVADRELYCGEVEANRLPTAARNGVKVLVPHSLYDPYTILRGSTSKYSKAQPLPDFPVYLYWFGIGRKPNNYDQFVHGYDVPPVNCATFSRALLSCLTVAGSVLQAAAIMGAKKIIAAGFEISLQETGPTHFYNIRERRVRFTQKHAPVLYARVEVSMKRVKAVLDEKGIKLFNLSPVKECLFGNVFGNHTLEEALA